MNNTDATQGAEAPALPLWLEEVLPDPIQPHVLSTFLKDDKRQLRITAPDGSIADFASVRDVAEAMRGESLDLIFEDDLYEHFGEGSRGFGLLYKVANPKHVGVFLPRSDAKRRASLERDYANSVEAQKLYSEDTLDFARAWRFIDTHPAFWTAYDLDEHPWHWETEGYCSKLRQYVSADKTGGYLVSLEAGGHVEHSTAPGIAPYSNHYGDWRLEVECESFEAAIVELAVRVSLSFNPDGSSIPEDDFPYDAPSWVIELQQQLKETS